MFYITNIESIKKKKIIFDYFDLIKKNVITFFLENVSKIHITFFKLLIIFYIHNKYIN